MSEETHERILPKRKTRLGWSITTVHWSAKPDYDYAAACEGLDEAGKRMELEIDWTATKGKRVYPEFRREIHVAKEPLDFDPDLPLLTGWDLPGCPAFLPAQINHYGQLCVYPPIVPSEDVVIGVWEFGLQVAEHLLQEYAQPYDLTLDDLQLVFIGDPAGFNKPSRTNSRRQEVRAAFEVLRHGSRLYLGEDDRGEEVYEERPGWGWQFTRGAVDNATRQNAVRARLSRLLPGGHPAMIVDPRADFVIHALGGGYRYKEYEDGSFSRDPLKDYWCVDEATQAMTPDGWKSYDQLKVGDPIYVLDIEKGGLRIGSVQAVNVHRGDIEAIRFSNRAIDMVVTPNHRCPVVQRRCSQGKTTYSKTHLVEAKDLTGTHYLQCHRSIDQPGKGNKFFSDEFVRLCAWVAAEGSYRSESEIVLYQSYTHNPQYCQELDELLGKFLGTWRTRDRMGKPSLINGKVIPATGMAMWKITRETAMEVRRWMPDKWPSFEMISRMSCPQMRLFLYEAIRGDGDNAGREALGPLPPPPPMGWPDSFFSRDGAMRISQSSKNLPQMERMQVMATLAGLDCHLTFREMEGGKRPTLTICRPKTHGLAVSTLNQEAVQVPMVWCPTTDAGTWVARRSGITFITGNSHGVNCLEYICSRENAQPMPRLRPSEIDEEDEAPRVISHASGAWRY